MNNSASLHYILAVIVIAAFGTAGYFVGIIMADPPLATGEREKFIQELVAEKIGVRPAKVQALTDDSTEFANLKGDVLEDQEDEQYYFVQLQPDSPFKSSALESGAETPDPANFRMVKIKDGQIEVKQILF